VKNEIRYLRVALGSRAKWEGGSGIAGMTVNNTDTCVAKAASIKAKLLEQMNVSAIESK
jgi:hypothetical protein